MVSEMDLYVLHTNDKHGNLRPRPDRSGDEIGGAPQRATLIKALRKGKEDRTVLIDGGDFWQGSLGAKLTRGKVVIDEMNAEGYDAALIGNHDLELGLEALREMAGMAKFPLVSANMRDGG